MEEIIWKPIKGYEEHYQINNYGVIRSLPRRHSCRYRDGRTITRFCQEKVIKSCVTKIGYPVLNLSKNGKPKTHYVHRLIAEHFLDNPKNFRQINHKDGCKTNNRLENLEWCNQAHNNKHALEKGLRIMPKGKNHCCYGLPRKKIFTKGVRHSISRSSSKS